MDGLLKCFAVQETKLVIPFSMNFLELSILVYHLHLLAFSISLDYHFTVALLTWSKDLLPTC